MVLLRFYLASLHSKNSEEAKTKKAHTRHSRSYLQQQNLIAKFLYHSLALNEASPGEDSDKFQPKLHNKQQVQVFISIGMSTGVSQFDDKPLST